MALPLVGCGLLSGADPTVARSDRSPSSAVVTLVAHGAEPRRPLRYEFTAGDTADLVTTVDLHVSQTTPHRGSAQVLDPPATTQVVRVTVRGTDARGAELAFEVVDAGIDPTDTPLTDVQVVDLTAAVQAVVGVRGHLRVDPTGHVTDLDYDDLGGLDHDAVRTLEDLAHSLGSLVPVLPVEPIGRGARWRSVSRSRAAGLTVRQVTEYEITGVDQDRVTYRATIGQSTPEQDLTDPDLGVRVLAADIRGTAAGMLWTSRLVTESETSLRGTQLLEQAPRPRGATSEPMRITQELDLTVTIAPLGEQGHT